MFLLKPIANTVSKTFNAPAQLSVFGMTKNKHTEEDGIVTESVCGDYITFERVAYDGVYDITCQGVDEKGELASEPLLEDGCEVAMNYANNSLLIEGRGTYRAIYHGDNRENILLIKE